MELNHIYKIEDWPTLDSVGEMQVQLSFTNNYRVFIRK